ncbi:MAG: hypothetical protein P8Y24_13565 [Gammaproteobacteria bacterium]|jgi:hypothetical protein
MIASSGFISVMVSIALMVTIIAPIVLIILWLKDWKKGQLW